MSESDKPSFTSGPSFEADVVQPRFHPDWSTAEKAVSSQLWLTLVGGTGRHGEKAPSSFSCLLSSFPDTLIPIHVDPNTARLADHRCAESWPSNDGFMYKRNWDFLQATVTSPSLAGHSHLTLRSSQSRSSSPTSIRSTDVQTLIALWQHAYRFDGL